MLRIVIWNIFFWRFDKRIELSEKKLPLGKLMLAFWSKSDMVRVNKNFTLAPNVKMVKPKRMV